jgi:acyl-CoA synthetase (AMP-forming)/AMP-acid ligase II
MAQTLTEMIAPGRHVGRIHFPDEDERLDHGELWNQSLVFGGWHQERGGGPVAMALSNTKACAATIIGAVAAGATLVSIPHPPRGAEFAWYGEFVRDRCVQTNCSTLLVDGALLPLLPALSGVSFTSFESVLATRRTKSGDPGRFKLIQFTSGSTSEPRGIELDDHKIATNLAAILEWLELRPGDNACSWLPLSHDMGLIGMFFAALAGLGDRWCKGGNVVLLTPEGFLRNPTRWLEIMSEFKATITSTPPFGMEMAVRRPATEDIRLDTLRVCIVGGEPIRPHSLSRFCQDLAPAGLSPLSLCPAYGLAECVLAVTGTPPDSMWHELDLTQALSSESGHEPFGGAVSVVGSGRPLRDVEVKIADSGGGLGEVSLRTPTKANRYSDGKRIGDSDGWFKTNDLGLVRDNELFVVGRNDDVLQVGGRNIYGFDVEAFVGELGRVRNGRVIAFVSPDGVLCVAAEPERSVDLSSSDVRELAMEIRGRIRSRMGIGLSRIAIVDRGQLLMTASGKIRRRATADALGAGGIEPLVGSIGWN